MFDDTSSRAAALKALLENRIFVSTMISLCSAQALKMLVHIIRNREKKMRELIEILTWSTGGMPSSHAAVVGSLVTSIAFAEGGISSNLFIFSFWFALVVLRDALGVRRSAGLMAKALNDLGKQASEKSGLDFRLVKEIQGHTPLEVAVGCLLGVSIAVGISRF